MATPNIQKRPVAPIENDSGLLMKALARILQVEAVGSMTAHLREILDLGPEEARVDVVSFQGSVTAAGAITQPTATRLNPDFVHEMYGVMAWRQSPATDVALPTNIAFNIRESGRNFDLFASNLPFAALASQDGGGGNSIIFQRGLYVFRAGSEAKVTFTVDSNYAGNASATHQWGVALLINSVRR